MGGISFLPGINIMKWLRRMISVMGVGLMLSACGSKEEEAAPAAAAVQPAPEAAAGGNGAASAGIVAARTSLKAGNVDEAAAKLAQMQMHRATFNAQQAKDYRQVLSEAYDRAIEAAQKGDPRAQAALELLRAAAPR